MLWIPALYLSAILLLGLLPAIKGAKGELGFLLAGRSATVPLLTGSLLATIFGSFGILGVAGLAWLNGLVAAWYLLVGMIGLAALGAWVLPRLDTTGAYSLPELLGRRYGGAVRSLSAILITIAWLGIIAAQFIAAGKLGDFLGFSVGWWASGEGPRGVIVSTMAAVVIVYTCLGGQYSVLRTDLLQACLIAAGMLLLVGVALYGQPDALSAVADTHLSFPFSDKFGAKQWAITLLTFGVPFLVGPDMYSRVLAGRDRTTARRAVLWAALLGVPLVLLVALAGVLGRSILGADLADREMVLLLLGQKILSPTLVGFLLAALLAAVMSSADTCLVTVSTLLRRDVLPTTGSGDGEKSSLVVRVIVFVAGVVALVLALKMATIIRPLTMAYSVYSPAILVPFLALVIHRNHNFHKLTGIIAMLSGALVALAGLWFQIEWLRLIAFLVPVAPIAVDLYIRRR